MNLASTTKDRTAWDRAVSLWRDCLLCGEFYEARKLYALLRDGKIKLYNGETDWKISCLLEHCGFFNRQSMTGRFGEYFLLITNASS
ncbi:MAG TPA: hypothetical protein PL124_02970 [Candidatus Cloacimonadota bacterium]|nr:hypothetical protein [Candidatus Cloacimonadota bacterium]HPS38354.1 hypothetical protein [Candidatus Cloacimonadota bacterium]